MVVDYRAETAWLDSILQPGQQHPEGAQGEEDHDDMLDDDDDDASAAAAPTCGRPPLFRRPCRGKPHLASARTRSALEEMLMAAAMARGGKGGLPPGMPPEMLAMMEAMGGPPPMPPDLGRGGRGSKAAAKPKPKRDAAAAPPPPMPAAAAAAVDPSAPPDVQWFQAAKAGDLVRSRRPLEPRTSGQPRAAANPNQKTNRGSVVGSRAPLARRDRAR